ILAAVLAVPASDQVSQAVDALSSAPGVYVAPGATGNPLSQADVDALTQTVQSASTPVFVAALVAPTVSEANADLHALIDGVHQQGTYVVVTEALFRVASDVPGVEGRTAELAQEAIAAHRRQPLAELTDLIQRVDDAAATSADNAPETVPAPVDTAPDSGSGGSSPFVPILIVGAIGLGLVALVRGGNRRRRAINEAALTEVRGAAEEDVTALGEQLTALDIPPASAPEAGEDYRAALDAYDRSKASLAAATHPEDLRAVTTALEEGRWRLACVRARLSGQPLPERRPPCFFNPQHGPSTTDVSWAPAGGQQRTVPVCAADADRLALGDDPDERLVGVGGSRVPYWQAPAYYRPYASGFFGGWGGGSFLRGLVVRPIAGGPRARFGGLGGLLVGQMLGGPGLGFGGWGDYDAAAYDGFNDSSWQGARGGDFASQFDVGGGSFGGGGDFSGGFDSGGGGFDGGGGGGDGGGGGW